MNYYLDAILQMQITKLNELKTKGATSIDIDIVLKLLKNIQKINIGETPDINFSQTNDKNNK